MIRRLLPSHRWRLSPWAVLWLTVVWVMLWGTVSPMTVVGGAFVSVIVLALFPLPHVYMRLRPRLWPLIVLIARYSYDLVTASVQVAWLSVRPGEMAGGVVMDMELMGDDELLQVLTGEMVTLVPGSVVIELDPANRVLTLHALDIHTRQEAEALRRRVRAQEARVLRALHPDPESQLNPRRRREAQRQAAEEGPVSEAAADASRRLDRPVDELRPDEQVRPDEGPQGPDEEGPR